MAHLFTIICEYKGGTYTQQVHGENPVEAFTQWAEGFVKEDVLPAPEKKDFAGEVQYSLAEGNLVAMEGLQNVWYEGFSLGNDLLEVIIVGMSGQPIQPAATASQRIPVAHS